MIGLYRVSQVKDHETISEVAFGKHPVQIKSNRILAKVDNVLVVSVPFLTPSRSNSNVLNVMRQGAFPTMTIGARKKSADEQLLFKALSKLKSIRWNQDRDEVQLITERYTIRLNRKEKD